MNEFVLIGLAATALVLLLVFGIVFGLVTHSERVETSSKARSRTTSALFIGAVGAALCFYYFALDFALDASNLLKNGITTSATVVETESWHSSGIKRPGLGSGGQVSILEFNDESGRKFRISYSHYISKGEEVPVSYHRSNPRGARPVTFYGIWERTLSASLLAVTFALLGFLIARAERKKRKQVDPKEQNPPTATS